MGWAEIIAAVMKVIGPWLSEWLKKWLEKSLKAAAKSQAGPDGFRNGPAAAAVLFAAVLEATPRRMGVRRALLAKLAQNAGAAMGVEKWSPAERIEVKSLAAAAEA